MMITPTSTSNNAIHEPSTKEEVCRQELSQVAATEGSTGVTSSCDEELYQCSMKSFISVA